MDSICPEECQKRIALSLANVGAQMAPVVNSLIEEPTIVYVVVGGALLVAVTSFAVLLVLIARYSRLQ